jgi:hypothetical protein
LPEGKGIGHLAAFRYHRPTRVILLQHNPLSATPQRIGVYLMGANPDALYAMRPVLREDAIDRFKTRQARSFTVQFASPQNLESLDDKLFPSFRGAKLLAEAFNGLYLTVTVDVGKSTKKFLNSAAVRAEVEQLLGADANIKKLRVGTSLADDEDERDIDFLQEHMRCSKRFDLPEAIKDNYQVRRQYFEDEFGKQIGLFNKMYGPKPHGRAR